MICLDYCNAHYLGVSGFFIAQLQRVQHAALRLSTGTYKYENISPILSSLHWLLVHFRIHYKFFIIIIYFFYLWMALPHPYKPSCSLRSADHLLLSASKTRLKLQRDELLLQQLRNCGMSCPFISNRPLNNQILKLFLKPSCFFFWLLTLCKELKSL